MSIGPSREHAAEMFDKISPTYDFLNSLLSCGIDRYWRWQTARHFDPKRHVDVLDLATGTGDQLVALAKRAKSPIKAIGVDPSPSMLKLARAKCAKHFSLANCFFLEGRADALPFSDASFDLITMSFGIRNVEDVVASLKEMRRVLRPKGKLLILEFSLPSSRFIRALHFFYLKRCLPKIGKWISKDAVAYTYLAATITTFPFGDNFCDLMKEAGFSHSSYDNLTFGIANLYVAENR